MALFEFEDGRLIPARFGYPVDSGFTPEVMDAVCSQVLEIVSRPLFPITWRDVVHGIAEQDAVTRLTALDATGQVVSVEVVARLDSEILIDSLSRLAQTAALSWTDLATEYPGGPPSFKAGWVAFHESMPPSPGAGPRLVMVVGEIDPQVRPALDVLADSGVEVHEISLRRMSNGRIFLDVLPVGPRVYSHAPQLLANSQSKAVLELSASEAPVHAEQIELEPVENSAAEAVEAVVVEESEVEDIMVDDECAALSDAQDDVAPERLDEPADVSDASESAESEEAMRIRELREAGIPVLARDDAGFAALAQIIGEEVPLVAHPDCEAPDALILGPDAVLRSGALAWTDLASLEIVAPKLADAWENLRIADLCGPSLAEAIAEINAEMVREYEAASGIRTSGRHTR